MLRKRFFAVSCAAAALTAPAALRAAEFDAATGRLSLDGAYAYGFEADDATPVLRAFDATFEPQPASAIEERFADEPDGLQGSRAWLLGGTVAWAAFPLDDLAEFGGRRVEVRFWMQPRGTRATGMLGWYSGSRLVALLPLQPTGRGTDDGWRELSSGPIDFELGGLLPATYLLVHDDQTASDGLLALSVEPDDDARAAIDAIEIEDLGPAAVPASPCTLADEDDTCGEQGVCLYARCADAAAVVGPLPLGAARQRDYVDRRAFEIGHFEAIRKSQAVMNDFAASLEALRDAPSSKAFWPALRGAWEKLHDGHAYPPVVSTSASVGIGVCMNLGEADLSPEGGSAPMVFSADPTHPIGSRLHAGDVLRAIDGLDVAEWSTRAARALYYPGDPANRDAIVASELLDAALATGATLEFERCEKTTEPCSPAEVESIVLDLGDEVSGSLWAGDAAPELDAIPVCDFRFTRAVDGPTVGDHDFAGYADEGAVRTVQWNGFPYPWDPDLAPWSATMNEALAAGPPFLLLDERYGGGGPDPGWMVMFGHLLAESDAFVARDLPWIQPELDAKLAAELDQCATMGVTFCGGFVTQHVPVEGASHACAASRVAMLIGQDVSGNDFFTRFMTFRSGATRIFGPGPTYGGFGAVTGLPRHGIGLSGGTVQMQDTFFAPAGSAPKSYAFESAAGVTPDEVVLQKQSDAVIGKDTVVAAATAWLLGGS